MACSPVMKSTLVHCIVKLLFCFFPLFDPALFADSSSLCYCYRGFGVKVHLCCNCACNRLCSAIVYQKQKSVHIHCTFTNLLIVALLARYCYVVIVVAGP